MTQHANTTQRNTRTDNAQPAPTNRSAVTVNPATPSGPPTNDPSTPTASSRNRVFVSPRVLDDNAFQAYASELKELLARADDRAAAADDATKALADTERKLSALAARQREHLELASRVLKAIDKRAKEAERAAPQPDPTPDPAPAPTPDTDELDHHIERALAIHAERIHDTLDANINIRLDTLEQLLQSTTADTTTHPDNAIAERINALVNERIDAIESCIAERVEARLDAAQHAAITAAEERAEDARIDLERDKAALKSLLTNAHDARQALERTLASAETEQLAELAAIAERLNAILNPDDDTPTLASQTDRAETALAKLEQTNHDADNAAQTLNDLRDTLAHAEHARERIDAQRPAIEKLAESVPALADRANRVTADLNAAADRAAHHNDHLADLITAGELLLQRLQPWHDLLANPAALDDPQHLPPALDHIAAALRANIAGLTRSIADAIASTPNHQPAPTPDPNPAAVVTRPVHPATTPNPTAPDTDAPTHAPTQTTRFRQITNPAA